RARSPVGAADRQGDAHRRRRAGLRSCRSRAPVRARALIEKGPPMRITPVALLLAAVAAATLSAQEARDEPRTKPAPAAAAKVTPVPDAKPEPPRPPGQLANTRIEVKITDEGSGQPATTKLASLTVADHRDGSIRSNSEFRVTGTGGPNMGQLPLNVDASPVIEGSRIRLNLGVEYSILDAS